VLWRTGLLIEVVGRSRRILRNEEFDDLCVGKCDEVMGREIDGNVYLYGS
jgi:hypothetical protein